MAMVGLVGLKMAAGLREEVLGYLFRPAAAGAAAVQEITVQLADGLMVINKILLLIICRYKLHDKVDWVIFPDITLQMFRDLINSVHYSEVLPEFLATTHQYWLNIGRELNLQMDEVVEDENQRNKVRGQTDDTNFQLEDPNKNKKRKSGGEEDFPRSRKKPRKSAKVADTSKTIKPVLGKAEDRVIEDGDYLPAMRKTASLITKKILDLDPTLDISDDDSDDDKLCDPGGTPAKTEKKRGRKKLDDDEYRPENKKKSGIKSKLKREVKDSDHDIDDDDDDDDNIISDDDDDYVPEKEHKKTKSNRSSSTKTRTLKKEAGSKKTTLQEDVVFDLLKQNITFSLGQLMTETEPDNIEVSIDNIIDQDVKPILDGDGNVLPEAEEVKPKRKYKKRKETEASKAKKAIAAKKPKKPKKVKGIRQVYPKVKKAKKSCGEAQCTLCGSILKDEESLRRHEYVMHSEHKEIYKCDQCDKTFIMKSYLRMHIKDIHNAKPWVCDICGATKKSRNGIKSHMSICQLGGKRTLSCPDCPQMFRHRTNLAKHRKRIHQFTPDLRKQCGICEKWFNHNEGLNRHIRLVHSDERPFSCSLCGASFAFNYDLTRHTKKNHPETLGPSAPTTPAYCEDVDDKAMITLLATDNYSVSISSSNLGNI